MEDAVLDDQGAADALVTLGLAGEAELEQLHHHHQHQQQQHPTSPGRQRHQQRPEQQHVTTGRQQEMNTLTATMLLVMLLI